MKRLNGLHDRICTLQNIEEADKNARKGKHNWGIIKYDQLKGKQYPVNFKIRKYVRAKEN